MGALPKKHVTQDAVLEALEVVATGLGAKIEAAEARTSAKIDALETKVDRHQAINSDNFIELSRKLSVLMAHLGVMDEKQS